jgi:hypothetical protein
MATSVFLLYLSFPLSLTSSTKPHHFTKAHKSTGKIRTHPNLPPPRAEDEDITLPPHDEEQEEGGRVWMYRHQSWRTLMRGWSFGIEGLKSVCLPRLSPLPSSPWMLLDCSMLALLASCASSHNQEPVTRDLYHALHQSGNILIAFLQDWHAITRTLWMDIHYAPGVTIPVPSHQEIIVTGGMMVCNKIVTTLEVDANWEFLYGEEMTEAQRQALYFLVFDTGKLEMGREGGVDGEVGVRYPDPEEVVVRGAGKVVVDDGKRDVATQTPQLPSFDPLYDYEDLGTQTEGGVGVDVGVQTQSVEVGEEKERHDSGVGLDVEEPESSDEEGGVEIGSTKKDGHTADDEKE